MRIWRFYFRRTAMRVISDHNENGYRRTRHLFGPLYWLGPLRPLAVLQREVVR